MDTRASAQRGKAPSPARLSDYDIPYLVMRGYSWIFLFDRAHQPRNRYSPGTETTILGRRALAIAVEPVPPVEEEVNDWFGTFWIDAETLQLLRVQAMKAAEHEKEQAFRASLAASGPLRGAARDGWVVAHVETEFTHEKHAMRFPGKTIVTGRRCEVRIRKGARVPYESTIYTVTQLYTGYRFFSVKAEELVRSIASESPD